MERIGKEWLWRHIYQIELNGRNTLVAPEFKELMRAALIALVRCCTKVLLWEKKIMGMNKRKKRKLDKEKKLEQMVLKTY